MLKLLGQKYKKHIAFLLISIFYVDLLGQLHAAITNARPYFFVSSAKRMPGLYPYVKPLTNAGWEANKMPATQPAPMSGVVQKAKKMAPPIGPTQPESSSFQSASTENMVDLFSGGFAYNTP